MYYLFSQLILLHNVFQKNGLEDSISMEFGVSATRNIAIFHWIDILSHPWAESVFIWSCHHQTLCCHYICGCRRCQEPVGPQPSQASLRFVSMEVIWGSARLRRRRRGRGPVGHRRPPKLLSVTLFHSSAGHLFGGWKDPSVCNWAGTEDEMDLVGGEGRGGGERLVVAVKAETQSVIKRWALSTGVQRWDKHNFITSVKAARHFIHQKTFEKIWKTLSAHTCSVLRVFSHKQSLRLRFYQDNHYLQDYNSV